MRPPASTVCTATRRSDSGGAAARAIGLGLAGATLLLAGCAPPGRGTAGGAPVVYVASGLDGTVTRLDGATGRPLGAPLPAGAAPLRIVAGGGGLLVLSSRAAAAPGTPDASGGRDGSGLTHVAPVGDQWVARAVALEPRAGELLLAGDGGRYAAAAYQAPPEGSAGGSGPSRCRLAVIDVPRGAVERTHTVCGAGESVRSLALDSGPAGAIAYAGIWRWPARGDGSAGRGRVVAIEVPSGRPVGGAVLAGEPRELAAGRAVGQDGRRLYCVEALPGPHRADDGADSPPPERWQLVQFDAPWLEPGGIYRLPFAPARLAVAADGRAAYTLTPRDGTPRSGGTAPAGGTVPAATMVTSVAQIDLADGTVRRLADLPGLGLDLAVSPGAVYVPNASGGEVWIIDRRAGVLARSVAVGRHPTSVALSTNG